MTAPFAQGNVMRTEQLNTVTADATLIYILQGPPHTCGKSLVSRAKTAQARSFFAVATYAASFVKTKKYHVLTKDLETDTNHIPKTSFATSSYD